MFDFFLSSLKPSVKGCFTTFILNNLEWDCIWFITQSLIGTFPMYQYYKIDFPTQEKADCLADILEFVLEELDNDLIEANIGIWWNDEKECKEYPERPGKSWYSPWSISREKLEKFIVFIKKSGGFIAGHPNDWYVRQRQGRARPVN